MPPRLELRLAPTPPPPRARARAPVSATTDADWVKAAQAGDGEAFGHLVRRFQPRLRRLVQHILRDENLADDVTQESFVRAFRALDRFDGRSQPFTWFYRIAVNVALNKLRAQKKHAANTGLDAPGVEQAIASARPQSTPHLEAGRRQLQNALQQSIDGLSESLRTTLVLVIIDGMSHADAAEILGCPEGTVAWRIHEARRKIRLSLQERGHDEAAVRP